MRCLPVVLLSTLLAGSIDEHVVFHTGFEGAAYAAGQPLAGQDDWTAVASPNAAVVVRDHRRASHGRQAVQCWGGSDLVETNGILDGVWLQELAVDAARAQHLRVRVECDVRLDGPTTGTGAQNDLVSANLYALDNGGGAFFFLSSNGSAWAFSRSEEFGAFDYQLETPIEVGEYNTLAITLDYATFVATFEVNGEEVGTLPFGDGVAQQFHGTALEFGAYSDPQIVDASAYTAYWDDLAVTAQRRKR